MGSLGISGRVKVESAALIVDGNIQIAIPNVRYRADDKPQSGENGVVVFGHDSVLNREVVVKVWPPKTPSSSTSVRAREEARSLACLKDENIARVYHAGEVQGCFFCVMEKIDGNTLEDWLEQEDSFKSRYFLFLKITKAVHYAHGQGVYHGDLHTKNVIIQRDGEPKIIDFGSSLACESKEQHQQRESVVLMGTANAFFLPHKTEDLMCLAPLAYSPEQILAGIDQWAQSLWVLRELKPNLRRNDDHPIKQSLFELSTLMSEVPLFDFEKTRSNLESLSVPDDYMSVFLGDLYGSAGANLANPSGGSYYCDASPIPVERTAEVKVAYEDWQDVYREQCRSAKLCRFR